MSPSHEFEVFAPGRVNLIGEHTDYNDGFVLPLAIEPGITLQVRRRDDRLAVLVSDRHPGITARIDLADVIAPAARDWTAYPCGVLAGCQRLGWQIPGFEATVRTNLPAGGGLSSSAALEVATATALEALCGRGLTPHDKALLCQAAEHEFAGVPCGIMDQFAVTCGRPGHALLLDCRSREIRYVPLAHELAVLIANSGVRHSLADGEYGKRRAECDRAARALGLVSLRDATAASLAAGGASLDPVARRRAAHVVSENDRVSAFAAAVDRQDWPGAGRLMAASHASLRDDYEVSCAELDRLVEIAAALPGVFGCRMTGGGFGGCMVALVARDRATAVMEAIRGRYRAATGIDAALFITSAAGGPVVRPAAGRA